MAAFDPTTEEVPNDWSDFVHTGPGTLAGRYLRMFWQPVYISNELPAGQATTFRLLSEDFTLYRGTSGMPHLLQLRCAHRATQLHAERVVARHLQALPDPNQAIFYTSGRASNEAAFSYQLFARAFGTNNLPDCSNMCHESTSVGLAESIGIG